jgi:sugar phosphate permease
MWGIGVTAYGAAVFQRGSLAVSGLAFQHRFHANATDLALLAVMQLLVYASLQIPVGLLLDRVGPRLLISTGGLLMAAGQAVIASSHSVPTAIVARVLVGAGDATTFISALRLITAWFPSRQIALLTQLTGIIGQLGQVIAAFPLVALLRSEGWGPSFIGASVASLVVSAVVLAGLRDGPARPGGAATGESAGVARPGAVPMRENLAASWAEPGTRMGLWTHFVNQFSGVEFTLLWGYPFMVDAEKLPPSLAGGLISAMVLLGMGVGPAIGGLSGQWPLRRSALTMIIVGSSAATWTLVLAWPGRAPTALIVVLAVVLSSNGPGSLIGFDYARTFNPPARMGSASGIVNVGGFVATITCILGVGIVLAALGHDTPSTYTLGAFRLAFVVQYPIWALGMVQVLRTRRRLRARRAVEGIVVDPLHRAVRRRLAR